MDNRLVKFLAVGSIVAGGTFTAYGSALAGTLNSGDTFRVNGNVFFTGTQFDWVGPNTPGGTALPSLDQDGFFTMNDATGGFTNGVFNPSQVQSPRASFLKDIQASSSTGTAISTIGPEADGSDDPLLYVPDWLRFDNIANGGDLNFSIELQTLLRTSSDLVTPPSPNTRINEIRLAFTGILTDNAAGGKQFLAIGSLTPNLGAGSPLAALEFGDLVDDSFQGPVGYTMDWEIVNLPVAVPESSPVSALIGLGLVGSVFALKRKVQLN